MHESSSSSKKIILDETVPLISFSSQSGWVKFTDWLGGIFTFGAMVPQGFLGVLLTDLALKSLGVSNIYYRILPDGVMFFTAEEGKRQLVRFFNTEAFKNLGRAQTWKDFFDRSQWSTSDYITFPLNTITSIVPSATFAYITHLAFEGMSPLLKAYKIPITDFLASQVLNPWVQRPFMLASFICNMFGFPNIHKGALNLIKDAFYYFVENPKFRKMRATLYLRLEATRLEIKGLHEVGNIENAKKILGDLQDRTTEDLRVYLLKNAPQKYIQNPESWAEFIHKNIMGLSLVAIALWGLISFYPMGVGTANFFFLPMLASAFGTMASASIFALGFNSAYTLGTALINKCYGRNTELNILSTGRSVWVLALTSIIAFLGSAPNAYQSIIANVDTVGIIVAFFSSTIGEAFGIYTVTKTANTKKIISNDNIAKSFHELDKKLSDASNLSGLSEKEIHTLYRLKEKSLGINEDEVSIKVEDNTLDSAMLPSQYRESFHWVKQKIYSFKNSITHSLFGKSTPNLHEDIKDKNTMLPSNFITNTTNFLV